MLNLLLTVALALATIGQPCNADTDCTSGIPRGLGHCTTPVHCEAPAAIYRVYLPEFL